MSPETNRAELERQTYLTVDETRVYLRFPTDHAVHMWAIRQRVPKCRVGRKLLFLRRDLDEAVQPKTRRPRAMEKSA